MILGIGTDIVTTKRIEEKVLTRDGFRKYVFSEEEIAYCEKVKNCFESYAVRFAAKEAFLKCLGTGLAVNAELNEIEIQNTTSGKPEIKLSEALCEKVKEIFGVKYFKAHVSLSHTSEAALAFIIIETDSNELA